MKPFLFKLYLQRLKRTSDKLNCEKSLWEGTDQCKIPTKGWEQEDYMHIRPKSGFSHCRAGDCSELSHMLVLFIYLDLFIFTCFLFLKMSILICPVAVAQFMAVVYLCFETLSIITPTHAILMTRIRCHFQGPLMVIVSRALKTTYTSAGISFVLQDSVGMNASDRSDTVTVCVPVGFSLFSCCRTGKTFRWS